MWFSARSALPGVAGRRLFATCVSWLTGAALDREAGPQLLLQAFLQRVVNAGGRVEREYGLGRMRTDLLIVLAVRGATGPQPAYRSPCGVSR